MAEVRLIEHRPFYLEPWHGSYRSMMDRCYRKKAKNYPSYGGRGIKVCEEWHSVENFSEWVQKSDFSKGMTLERKDVNGDYCPENCIWATPKQQANNRRNTVFIEYNGESHTISEWAELLGIKRSTLSNRYYHGQSLDDIFSKELLYSRCGKKKGVGA